MRPVFAVLLTIGLAIVVVTGMVALLVLRPGKPTERTREGPLPELSLDRADGKLRAGIETEPITYRELYKEVRLAGRLDYNETRVAVVTTLIAGRVDHPGVDSSGVQVRKGDRLAEIFSDEVVAAQNELLRALDSLEQAKARQAAADQELALADLQKSRKELLLLGVLPEQLAEIETARKPSTRLPIHAPTDGTVVEKHVRTGQHVKVGEVLYRIADLDPIWLYLDVPELELRWVQYGQPVEVTVAAHPEEKLHGVIAFISPVLDEETRTVMARVNLKNPDRKLKPTLDASATLRVRLRPDGGPEPTGREGKYVCLLHPEVVRDAPGRCPISGRELQRVPGAGALPPRRQEGRDLRPGKVLAIPATAVIDAGWHPVAYRETTDSTFELVDLHLGPRAQGKGDSGQTTDYFPVLGGLQEGDRVVVRGQSLLDSQR